MTRKHLIAITCIVFLGALPQLRAADVPLDAFPSDADVVIRLKQPSATIEKAAAMASTVKEELGAQIRDNSPFIGMLISSPTLAGVDQERDWLVVVFADSEADPSVVFAIPATDADALQDGLPEKMTSFVRDDWVFYCENAETLTRLEEASPESSASLSSEMNEEAVEVFDRGDLSIFVNVDHLTEVYADEIDAAGEQAGDQIAGRLGALQMVPGLDVNEAFGGGAEGAKEIANDMLSLAVAVVIQDTMIHVETYGDFKDGTSTAEAITGHEGSPLSPLATLPQGALVYFGLSGSLIQALQDGVTSSMSIAPPGDDQAEKLEELQKSLEGVEFASVTGAIGLGTAETGFLRFMSITEASPTDKIREYNRQSAELMEAELEGQGIKQEAEYIKDAETIGEHDVDLLSVVTIVDPNVNPFFGAIIETIQQAIFGPDGMETRFVYWDDRYMQMLGGGADAAAEALAGVDSGEPNGLEEVRAGLIEEPNVLLLLDVRRMSFRALQAIASNPDIDLPVDESILDAEEPEPTFIGLSIASEPQALRTKTNLPGVQLESIVRLIMALREMR
ncbi:MAG: hypothetical protein DWQ34_00515 [Planctomycetota bacterium]|nr:MAG: hypothetical protein DWQ34_00515 [Planctomycetota bacterium]REK23587.1 MAG: hypothetical protein DWQ41_16210 [Planctomycetota bacterium]REK31189.1 MAG: hypothetical protein DWQ45_20320 [Planctomycetota bacterium]